MSNMKINEYDITTTAQNKPTSTEQIALSPKLVHDGMSDDKLNDIFVQSVSKSQNKSDVLDININNPDKLKDTSNLKMSLS